MKKYVLDFIKRGLAAAAGGPVIAAIVYWILGANGVIETMTPFEVSKGILTSALMTFIAAGISVVYEIDRLPLMGAISLHSAVLYLDYILIYLLNGWLKSQLIPILIFTAVFTVGYAVIWLCIWFGIRAKTRDLNAKLPKEDRP